jgi:hypothetical protein
MGQDLSYVAETGPECRIYRSSSGHYVVQQNDGPPDGRQVATLACAYAACQAFNGDIGVSGSAIAPAAERR